MATYSFKNLDKWASKIVNRQDRTFQGAVKNLVGGVRVVPGITKGGGRIRGTVPYDKKVLADSVKVTLYGGTSLGGLGVFASSGGLGQTAEIIWTAKHARFVHNGARGVPGTFWTEIAAIKWPRYVDSALASAKAFTR